MKENNTVIHMLAQLVSSFEGLSDPKVTRFWQATPIVTKETYFNPIPTYSFSSEHNWIENKQEQLQICHESISSSTTMDEEEKHLISEYWNALPGSK